VNQLKEIVPVNVGEGDAFDIRYGNWTYKLAHNNPHRDPWLARNEHPVGLLLIFESSEARSEAFMELTKAMAQEKV
jgi:hypothetical protein